MTYQEKESKKKLSKVQLYICDFFVCEFSKLEINFFFSDFSENKKTLHSLFLYKSSQAV